MSDPVPTAPVSAEELAELVSVVSRFAKEVPGRDWAALDAGSEAAIGTSWDGLREIGLDRCVAREEAGGVGLPDVELPRLIEELATGDGGVAMLVLLANVAAGALPSRVLEGVHRDARLAYVPHVGARERRASLPRLVGGKLSGEAPFAIGAFAAGGFVIACVDDADVALAYVDGRAPGLSAARISGQLGLCSARVGRVTLDGAEAARVGGAREADHAEAVLHAGIAAIARGTARRARALAQAYAENRYQGGRQIIDHGAVRDMLARMIERELASSPPSIPGVACELAVGMARKIATSDAAVATSIDAIQVFGGMGYMRETGVEKLMRDAKYCQLYPRPNWVARGELLELDRLRA